MRLGIMQPYFIPYIGYWQLMNAVDKYVVYDDVNFIKGGWINRNRIMINGEVKYFNIQMNGASPNKLINEVMVNNAPQVVNKNLRILDAAYKKAPYFDTVMPLFEEILLCDKTNIAEYIFNSFEIINDYIGIETELIMSSSFEKNTYLKAQDKVLDICRIQDATEYVNAIGGMELYSKEAFKEQGIELKFLKTSPIVYDHNEDDFVPNLSILDVMMFISQDEIRKMLSAYELI